MSTALVTHRDCVKHEISAGHPECPQRIDAINDQLMKQDIFDHLRHLDAPLASREALMLAHPEAYVDMIHAKAPASGSVQLDADTAMNPYSLNASLRAAGAGILATDRVCNGEISNAFCLTRPPGHHAERAQAMGFCFFGNIAIAARHAVKSHGLERVAIVDFDVHHGNGTQDLVEDDARILFCSTHQSPLYPGTGAAHETGVGNVLNCPLPNGAGSKLFRDVMTNTVLPRVDAFAPEILIISAGFDAHKDDPLAGLNLVEDDFAWVTRRLCDLAATHCQGRVVSALEGGYDLPALGASARAHVDVLKEAAG